ncbi:nucleotidyltransferase domain-containing protein [Marinospirillum insulare]|uniref:Polymerase nucleotidyl transferase domain-containing protein n=1 Tax=Marinospirillum insulare TaxID=217169 RepID=A0ABQ5ZY37_9GAMM|nr:nucleotidyltransferase domain-containing protein [Marinospirillum insulare]GLR64406.1 hypothetical protein GCM10007878_18440 [Marinospirillum insulare]
MEVYSLVTAKKYTTTTLEKLRQDLSATLKESPYKNDICIVATGSYGRNEASSESDIDWYIIFDKDRDVAETIPEEIESIKKTINNLVPNSPGDTGTFDAAIKFSDMQINIGGEHDTNQTLTRRMLFLLEGTWLYNKKSFEDYRKILIEKYIKPTDVKENISRFLLNDIIRYYRTIATDFEYKVSEDNKEWGLRNIKLKFSRKLLYVSGVFAVAELYNLGYEKRIEKSLELFSLTPLERLELLTKQALNLIPYENFLQDISNPTTRDSLNSVIKRDRKENSSYVRLNKLADEFSENLVTALKNKYQPSHPIHQALVI